ncbi:MAG: class I tRNA ligase family protein [Candidatus Taylorbacteria bacterium]
MWEDGNYFTPKIDPSKKPFSLFLDPPNASGGMHVGNILMIALQDILARYHRAKGDTTLWIPGTDHGGYETQVTFERELEKKGKNRFDYIKSELFTEIQHFVEHNNELIKKQTKALGASVDWSRFRFTMDERSLKSVRETFRKMIADNLIYRRPYMVNYCSQCGTVLADIELNEKKENTSLYFIKFKVENSEEHLALATTRPEFLFATTHVLIHPADNRFAHHIGKILKNPISGHTVEVIESKRKFDPLTCDPYLFPFSPSYNNYDYGYTLRNSIPSRNLLDWNGNMIERNPGMKPVEARNKEILFLKELGVIEKIDKSYTDSVFLCKRGHTVESMIMLTWFLKLDDEKKSLKKPALEAMRKSGLTVFPKWREKALTGWINKMHDWPIARQNVWGIKIPVWYDISDPSKFMIWFVDRARKQHYGNLKTFLETGISLGEICDGLERIYASEGEPWVLEKEKNKSYLPETDTFDTWFSSGQWGTIVFDNFSPDFSYFYPSDSCVPGDDLLRLLIARQILLSYYLTDQLPYKTVYLHRLIKGSDGQKMSKSLGNAVDPEYYLEKFGADVTRMALISYTHLQEDFIFEEERLLFYQKFSQKLWSIGKSVSLAEEYAFAFSNSLQFSSNDKRIAEALHKLSSSVSFSLDRFSFAIAQEKLCDFIVSLENYMHDIETQSDNHRTSLSVLRHVYAQYLSLLHPFMPFMTEELHAKLYNSSSTLAATTNSDKKKERGS